MKVATVEMYLVKETKNCYRYEAQPVHPDHKPEVDCIYLQKSVLAGQAAPGKVLVTVEDEL